MRRVLVCVPFRARAFVDIVCWQTYSSLTHIRIENEEKYKADYCKAGTLGEGSSDSESVSEEGDSEGDEEGTFQNSSLGSCLNMLQPSSRKRALKTVRRRISLICAGFVL